MTSTASRSLPPGTHPGYDLDTCPHCNADVAWMATTDNHVVPITTELVAIVAIGDTRATRDADPAIVRIPHRHHPGGDGRRAVVTGRNATSGRGRLTSVVLVLDAHDEIPGPLRHQPVYTVHDWRTCPSQHRPAFTVA